jgi:hypothetical protein
MCFQNAGIASNKPTLFLKTRSPVSSLLSIFLHHVVKLIWWCECRFALMNDDTHAFGFTLPSA